MFIHGPLLSLAHSPFLDCIYMHINMCMCIVILCASYYILVPLVCWIYLYIYWLFEQLLAKILSSSSSWKKQLQQHQHPQNQIKKNTNWSINLLLIMIIKWENQLYFPNLLLLSILFFFFIFFYNTNFINNNRWESLYDHCVGERKKKEKGREREWEYEKYWFISELDWNMKHKSVCWIARDLVYYQSHCTFAFSRP